MASFPVVVLTIVLVQVLFVALMWVEMKRRQAEQMIRHLSERNLELEHSMGVLQVQLDVFTSRHKATSGPTTAAPTPPAPPPTQEELETAIRELRSVQHDLEQRRRKLDEYGL